MIGAASTETELAPDPAVLPAERKLAPSAAILVALFASLALWAAIAWLIHWCVS